MFIIPFNTDLKIKINDMLSNARKGGLLVVSPQVPHQEIPGDDMPRNIAICIEPNYAERYKITPSQYRFYFKNRFAAK